MKQLRNLVYAEIEAGKKDCLWRGLGLTKNGLSRETNTIFPHLKIPLEEIFFRNNSNKVFTSRQESCAINVLYPSLSKSFVLSICRRDPMKTQPWDIFARVRTAKCILGLNHDCSLEDVYRVTFFQLKFLIFTCVTYFIRQSLKIFTEKVVS